MAFGKELQSIRAGRPRGFAKAQGKCRASARGDSLAECQTLVGYTPVSHAVSVLANVVSAARTHQTVARRAVTLAPRSLATSQQSSPASRTALGAFSRGVIASRHVSAQCLEMATGIRKPSSASRTCPSTASNSVHAFSGFVRPSPNDARTRHH